MANTQDIVGQDEVKTLEGVRHRLWAATQRVLGDIRKQDDDMLHVRRDDIVAILTAHAHAAACERAASYSARSWEEAYNQRDHLVTPQDGDGWQPIETAPKDCQIMLWWPSASQYRRAYPMIGEWEDDRFAKKPRPYWTNAEVRWRGVLELRANQPTHWRPLPAPPIRTLTDTGESA